MGILNGIISKINGSAGNLTFKNLNGQISDPDHITFEPYEVPGLAPQRAVGK